jgi:hypothetical protein
MMSTPLIADNHKTTDTHTAASTTKGDKLHSYYPKPHPGSRHPSPLILPQAKNDPPVEYRQPDSPHPFAFTLNDDDASTVPYRRSDSLHPFALALAKNNDTPPAPYRRLDSPHPLASALLNNTARTVPYCRPDSSYPFAFAVDDEASPSPDHQPDSPPPFTLTIADHTTPDLYRRSDSPHPLACTVEKDAPLAPHRRPDSPHPFACMVDDEASPAPYRRRLDSSHPFAFSRSYDDDDDDVDDDPTPAYSSPAISILDSESCVVDDEASPGPYRRPDSPHPFAFVPYNDNDDVNDDVNDRLTPAYSSLAISDLDSDSGESDDILRRILTSCPDPSEPPATPTTTRDGKLRTQTRIYINLDTPLASRCATPTQKSCTSPKDDELITPNDERISAPPSYAALYADALEKYRKIISFELPELYKWKHTISFRMGYLKPDDRKEDEAMMDDVLERIEDLQESAKQWVEIADRFRHRSEGCGEVDNVNESEEGEGAALGCGDDEGELTGGYEDLGKDEGKEALIV